MFQSSKTLLGIVGVGTLALATVTLAGDAAAKTVKLQRRAVAVGDRFKAELTTKVETTTPGAPAKDSVVTKTSYICSLLGKAASGKFQTKLELDPEVTTVTEEGVPTTTTAERRTVTLELSEDETRIVPTSGMAAATGADLLAGRTEATVGETWTANKKVPLAHVVEVPVLSTYKVASIEKDAKGRVLVRIELASDGIGMVPQTGVRMKIIGRGHAVIDAAQADRPVEVKLAYRFIAEGGEGEDLESRTEMVLKTTDLAEAPALPLPKNTSAVVKEASK